MTKRFVFTPASIDALSAGFLQDPMTAGLRIDVLPSGKKVWKFGRRLPDRSQIRLTFGPFPARSIADARHWAEELNIKIDRGIDPREQMRAEEERAAMTVKRAHELYMEAVREGRASRSKRRNKPRTISDKQEIYDRDIAKSLGSKTIYDVAEKELIDLVTRKGRSAKVRANRLAAELKVFFGWAASLRGLIVGLENDPSRRLGDLRFPETPRARKLSLEELEWFLKALAQEERDFRRGFLVMLLTAARKSEVVRARRDEVDDGVWTIPADRSKNRASHSIALGAWGRALMATNSDWIFPAERVEGPRITGWYKARDRILARMSVYAGREISRFNPHDLRRTVRSNTKRLRVDFETAEAMLNHLKPGLSRIYDGYELEDEMAASFQKWENEVISLARKSGVADKLEVPIATAKKARTRPRKAAASSPRQT
ncbi:tyrosine-type recombinase/integrase [Sphingomonas oryzagri]